MAKKELNFEEAVAQLEKLSEELRSGKLSLDESIVVYDKCVTLFNQCNEILSQAKQKIEIYNPDRDAAEEFGNAAKQ